MLLAAQPTKKFVTVDELVALTLFLCSDADHRHDLTDGRWLDGTVEGNPSVPFAGWCRWALAEKHPPMPWS